MVILEEEFGEKHVYEWLLDELISLHKQKFGEGKYTVVEYQNDL